jgi:hypothetical protein
MSIGGRIMLRHILTVLAVGLTGCGILQVKTGPGTDYPCGVGGVVCPEEMCCFENSMCGNGGNGCPADSCCYTGGNGEFGAKPPVKKLTPAQMKDRG